MNFNRNNIKIRCFDSDIREVMVYSNNNLKNFTMPQILSDNQEGFINLKVFLTEDINLVKELKEIKSVEKLIFELYDSNEKLRYRFKLDDVSLQAIDFNNEEEVTFSFSGLTHLDSEKLTYNITFKYNKLNIVSGE